jgi:hypothetical protein
MNNNVCENNGLVNGWRRNGNRILHVEEMPISEVESLKLFDPDEIYLVETIDWSTFEFPIDETIHRKKYIFRRFADALKFAKELMRFYPGECPKDNAHREDVVALRPITLEEYCIFENVHNHMMGVDVQTPFVSDEEAKTLPDYDWIIMPV